MNEHLGRLRALLAALAGSVCLVSATPAAAVVAGQVDGFSALTTMNWDEGSPSPNPPFVNGTGGPAGAGDPFLQSSSSGGFGAGSRMVILNEAQWAGNYPAAQVVGIDVDLANLGATGMSIRIAIRSGSTWYASTGAFALPADGGVWHAAAFRLGSADLTQVAGTAALATVLATATEFRILSSASPDYRGDAMQASLGVDNITAVTACGDGDDNDADGGIDFDPVTFGSPGDSTSPPAGVGDPGCRSPSSDTENPLCQNGENDDADGKADYDGGFNGPPGSSFGGTPGLSSDPQCANKPWQDREKPRSCGLGFELVFVLAPLLAPSRRQRVRS